MRELLIWPIQIDKFLHLIQRAHQALLRDCAYATFLTSTVIACCLPPRFMPLPGRSVGIVQQNQIKKARKLQEDLRAEEEKLQAAHLARMRRAAAAEVAGDTAAKATSLSWLHCSLSEEEAEHLEHWLGLLKTILDMQAEQRQQDGQDGVEDANQQQSAEAAPATEALEAAPEATGGAAAEAAAVAAGETGDIMVWIKQPANRRHHLRVVLECLKELGAQDLPARELLTRQVRWLLGWLVLWLAGWVVD
eukprot:GHRQ01020629.1.p1 GENE.GHRQ01020629.1~~GHRQ01020629.1.p1  ORF type:complete len:249 (+),score=88.07 GHRQ01020629.1:34-780(+)